MTMAVLENDVMSDAPGGCFCGINASDSHPFPGKSPRLYIGASFP
jgi:hypothetical protein